MWNLISVDIVRISNNFFNLNNMEPAPGRLAPELEVKALKIVKLDVLEQGPGCLNRSLPLKMASQIPKNA